jgi:glutathione synthase/RimK-type ligase-like ATP-grasp enzyme
MAKSKHDEIAEKLAKEFGTDYKSHKGIDIITKNRVIEVETKKNSISQGIDQVQNSSKARYLAVNKININAALNATKGTGIGVMSESGKIIKKAGRKK